MAAPCCIIFWVIAGVISVHIFIILLCWRGSAVAPAPIPDIIFRTC
jgi:hypothetical protein